jgi:ribosomal protein S12 methylthiotransferase accessory factor
MSSLTATDLATATPGARAGSTGRIAVYGDGLLARSIDAALGSGGVREEPLDPAQCDLAVVTESAFLPTTLLQANRRLRELRTIGLPVHATWDAVTIGPLLEPDRPGCYQCVEIRMRMGRAGGPPADRELWERFASGDFTAPEPVLTSPRLAIAAALVGEEYELLRTGHGPRMRQALLRVDPGGLTVDRHPFLPCATCDVCGGKVPDDAAELAVIDLRPRPKLDPTSYRVDPRPRTAELVERFVDAHTGIVPVVLVNRAGSTVNAAATIRAPLAPPGDPGVSGYARTLDHRTSVTVALLEVLERYAGVSADLSKRTVVRASYRDLPDEDTLDPRALGLPLPELAAASEYITPYHQDLPMNWVWGWSFRHRRPLLVPESIGYYYRHRPPSIAYECSSGCALGGCLEEAILHGIFEVAERDGFLIMWYARLPVPRIDWRSVRDPVTRLLASQLEARTGCRLHLLDTTMPDSIPSVAAVVLNEDDRPDRVKALFGGGAHIDPEHAIRSAVREVTMVEGRPPLSGRDLERAQAMFADPDLVTVLDHHPQVSFLLEAGPRLAFLFGGRPTTVDEAFPPEARYVPAPDLSDDLRHAIDRYLDNGLDVIVVDQTIPEHRAADLACVKVIIPGTMPMTFGHRNRRAAGFRRLHELPVRLGYRTEPLPVEEINPHPHPFP